MRRTDKLATVKELGERELEAAGPHQLAIERFIHALARPLTLYLFAGLCAVWVLFNSLAGRAFDPSPFPLLEGIVTVFAAIIATCVLIAQTREKAEADRRANLALHVSLVAEQKTAKVISLLEELRRDLPNVRDRTDAVANELQHEIDARAVHSALAPEHRELDE
ncbi:MAG TPA: DUF1003 domain-containing protein [Kofleriaceae bacterium]